MNKIIVGIHGLSNKPSEETLKMWWLQAMNDGLKKLDHRPITKEEFKLAYWADLVYETPDPNPEPYTDPTTDQPDPDPNKIISIARNLFSDVVGSALDIAKGLSDSQKIDLIKNKFREKVVKDLSRYYDDRDTIEFGPQKGMQTRKAIRAVLLKILADHEGKEIFLIGHSMGSIIAYDVLRDLENSGIKVQQFVTIGSPLGLSTVKEKIKQERRGKNEPFIPKNVINSWGNLGDPKDLVSADLTLKGEYHDSGGCQVKDLFVQNGYRYKKNGEWEHNHHKSYGYLRTPALATHLKAFWEV